MDTRTGGSRGKGPVPFFRRTVERLRDAVVAQVELNWDDGSGSTVGEHLKQIERQIGIKDPLLLRAEDVPPGAEYLARTYYELRRGTVLTFSEMEAYQRVTGVELEYWEVDALRTIDLAVDAKQSELIRQRQEKQRAAAPPRRR